MTKKRRRKKGRKGGNTGNGNGAGLAEGSSGESAKSSRKVGLPETAKSIAIAVVLFVILRAFIVQTFVIISGSMESTLLVGDLLLVSRISIGSRVPFTEYRLPGYSEVRRRDVVVFHPHHVADLKLVKRLIGLPGDTVQMIDGALILNGEAQAEPYAQHLDPDGDRYEEEMDWQLPFLTSDTDASSYHPTRDTWGPLVVPPDHYFMLGDNRDNSLDSRYWGMLESWRLEGRAVFKYFSFEMNTVPFSFIRRIRWDRIFAGIR